MKIYLVGGAVRDLLLKQSPKDKDYVVVGSNINEMEKLEFKQVGNDFPVFLHPETGEEYALARTEVKTGKGYNGFSTYFSEDTTIEEDLSRRDLTINSIAYDEKHNQYIDPYNGQSDLKNKILRHTTIAFKEDPLRVIRLARFYARLPDFTIAEETKALCKEMVNNGELNHLTTERIWKEIQKVFLESVDSDHNKPSRFFYFLQEIGALKVILPELDALKDIPQSEIHHPEKCSFVHTMLVLDKATELLKEKDEQKVFHLNNNFKKEEQVAILFSALLHDLGKGVTPKEILPRHIGHEEAGVPLVEQVCDRLRVPSLCKHLSMVVCQDHLRIHRALENNHKTLVKMYKHFDYRRNPQFLNMITLVCQADSQGRLNFEDRPYPQREYLLTIFNHLKRNYPVELIEKYKNDTEKLIKNLYQFELNFLKNEKTKFLKSLENKILQNEIDQNLKQDYSKIMKFNQ